MNRYIASFLSFLIVFGLYGLYGWVAVPLFMPERSEAPEDSDTAIVVPLEDEPREDVQPYLALFPKNSWEWSPKVEKLNDEKTIILFLEDETAGNKAILSPCTIIFLASDENLSREEQIRRAVVLRTEDHAEIEFDGALDFSRFPLPKMVGGKLFGRVTVQGDMENPNSEDDLYLETVDVAFSESPTTTTISTINDVRFRFGTNRGEGAMLRLEMVLADPKNLKSAKTLHRVQFETLKYLNLSFPENGSSNQSTGRTFANVPMERETLLPTPADTLGKTASAYVPLVARRETFDESTPRLSFQQNDATIIDVRCQREFSFSADEQTPNGWVASFHGNVQVERTTPDGLKDRIDGNEIQIHFLPKQQAKLQHGLHAMAHNASNTEKSNLLGSLEPVNFRAMGRLAQGGMATIPARLTSPRNGGIVMVGDQILYDLRKNFLALETEMRTGASPDVRMFLQNRYDIRATKGFQYQMGVDGTFGLLTSEGAGSLRGNLGRPDKPRNVQMFWDKMQIEPYPVDPSQLQIQMEGRIRIDMEGFGKMTADKLDLWCRMESKGPSPTPFSTVMPTGQPSVTSNETLQNLAMQGSIEQQSGETANVSGNPLDAGKTLVPDRAVATGNVHFENGSGVCDVRQMQVLFVRTRGGVARLSSRWTPYIMTLPAPTLPNRISHSSSQGAIRQAFETLQDENGFLPPIRQVQYQTDANATTRHTAQNSYAVMPSTGLLPNLSRGVPQIPPTSVTMPSRTQPTRNAENLQTVIPLFPTPTNQSTLSGTLPDGLTGGVLSSASGISTMVSNSAQINSEQNYSSTTNPKNLLGFHSGDSGSKFAITAERMLMNVLLEEKDEPVERIWLGGNVRVVEKIADITQGDLIEITGNEIIIWNPSTLQTTIRITGKLPGEEAVFKGKGVQLNAMKVEIFRAENKIWIDSPGRLLTKASKSGNLANADENLTPQGSPQRSREMLIPLNTPGRNTPDTPSNTTNLSSDERLLVEWNGNMEFDGGTITFQGKPDKSSGRVRAYHQDRKMLCDVMQVHLNRTVQFFGGKSKDQVEAEQIYCAGNVDMESRQLDVGHELKSFYRGHFESLRVLIKSNDFMARGPGFLKGTSLGNGKGFTGSSKSPFAAGKEIKPVAASGELSYLCVWFQDAIRGNFFQNQMQAEITGRVETIYCPVRTWDDEIERSRINAAIKTGYYLICERLNIVQMPDPRDTKKSFIELTAGTPNGTAEIEGEGTSFFGKARTIKYNQEKSLIVFDGSAYIQSKQLEYTAERIEHNIETGATSTVFGQSATFTN